MNRIKYLRALCLALILGSLTMVNVIHGAASDTAENYVHQGDVAFDQGKYEEASVDYSHAIELKPDFAEAYNNRAYTYMWLHRYDLALTDLNRALELRPNYVHALINRGDIYNFHSNPPEYVRAIADYDRAIQLDPLERIASGHRAMAYLRQGNPFPLIMDFLNFIRPGATMLLLIALMLLFSAIWILWARTPPPANRVNSSDGR